MTKLQAIQLIINAKDSYFVYVSESNGTVGFNQLTFNEIDLITEWLNLKMDQQKQENAVKEANKIINTHG